MKMIKLKNTSNQTYKFELATVAGKPTTKYEVAPGEVCEVAFGYCQSQPGGRSVMERRAPGLKPLDECPTEETPKPASLTSAAPAPLSSDFSAASASPKPKKKWASKRKAKKD